MVALAILKAYWRPILTFAFVALCVWLVVRQITVYGERKYTEGYDQREAEYAEAKQKLADKQARDAEKREVRTNELVTELDKKLDAIAARPAGKPVWMCPQPSVSASTGPASGDGTASADEAAQGESSGAVRDIGPGARAITDDGDRAIEQLTALQAWVTRECLRPPSTN